MTDVVRQKPKGFGVVYPPSIGGPCLTSVSTAYSCDRAPCGNSKLRFGRKATGCLPRNRCDLE